MFKLTLVVLQFLTAGALIIFSRVDDDNSAWMIFSIIGVAIGVWAIATIGPRRVAITPDVQPDTKLTTVGPYKFVRHPMYTALLLFDGGFVFTPFHWWKVGTWLILLGVLIAKSNIEERQLLAHFNEYLNYKKRTWRFMPFLW